MSRSGSTLWMKPRPLHSGQAPSGLLKENILGSSSSMLTPCSGHASDVLKVRSVCTPSGSMISTSTSPSPLAMASSQASESLLCTPSLTLILSTTISMVCLYVFSSFISSSSRILISPSTRALVKPSLRILSRTFSCWPLRALTTGAMTVSLLPAGSSMSVSTIWSTDWLVISLPQIGQCGMPILAYKSLR